MPEEVGKRRDWQGVSQNWVPTDEEVSARQMFGRCCVRKAGYLRGPGREALEAPDISLRAVVLTGIRIGILGRL